MAFPGGRGKLGAFGVTRLSLVRGPPLLTPTLVRLPRTRESLEDVKVPPTRGSITTPVNGTAGRDGSAARCTASAPDPPPFSSRSRFDRRSRAVGPPSR